MFCFKKHKWVTKNDSCPLISNLEECQPITVTEDEVKNSIRTLSKLDTLILIKTMIKKKSFCNPFKSKLNNESSFDDYVNWEVLINTNRFSSFFYFLKFKLYKV